MAREKPDSPEALPSEPTVTPTTVTFDQRLTLVKMGLTFEHIAECARSGLSFDQMVELGEAMKAGQASQMAAGMALQIDALAKANAEVLNQALDRDRRELAFPDISHFNPKGEKAHPRQKIEGEVFWLETRLDASELEPEEIELVNRLRPGVYHHGQWEVRNRNPHGTARQLQVVFPNAEPDERSNLPPSMTAMLREMVGEVVTPAMA